MLEVPRKVRPAMFILPAAETMTFPPDSVILIMAAASARPESDAMARNVAKVSGTILAELIILNLVLEVT